jgi:hypothetical protein
MSSKDGGSGAQAGAAGASAQGNVENKTAKISIDQALAENIAVKKELEARDNTIAELTKQLKAANDVLEGQTKAQLIGEILPRSSFTIEDLSARSVEELQHIRVTLDQAKLPTYKNVRFGSPYAGDEGQREDGLTVGDLSVVTEAKRKAGRS